MTDPAKAWAAEFEKLPEERRAAIKQWYEVQAYMAAQLGLPVETWMGYVQWAFAHPFDYSFIADFPDMAAAMSGSDGFEKARSSAALLGQEHDQIAAAGSKPSGNSLFDFMLGRAGEDEEPTEPR